MIRILAFASLLLVLAACGDDAEAKLDCPEDCAGETPHCDASRGLCVSCVDDGHCEDPLVCFTTSAGALCGECRDADDCGEGHCVEGACIECTLATEAADCGAFACDPETLTCTETERGSLDRLEPCRADSECATDYGYACVMTRFDGADDGLHCLKAASEGCSRPLTTVTSDERSSASWAEERRYCGFNEAIVSAEAVRAMIGSRTCDSESDHETCGQGGLCRLLDGSLEFRCTIPCEIPEECPSAGAVGDCHSGAGHCGTPAS